MAMAKRILKYRIYPNKKTANKLLWTLERCGELYNAALQERREIYKYTGQGTNYAAQSAQLPEIKTIREEYREIFAQVLQDTLRRVDKAFQAFFRRVKAGEKPGYPRFQGMNRFDSFTYPQAGFSLTHDNRIVLSKIGAIKVKLHREIAGTIKTCTIKREGTEWYVCFSCEVETMPEGPQSEEVVGIDLGVSKLATLSTGDAIENPRWHRRAERKLKKTQQVLARKKRGSKRRRKAAQTVAKLHRKTRNQRTDYLHKWSCRLVRRFGTIVFEKLVPRNMVKRPKPKQVEGTGEYLPNGASAKAGLNKSILDASWYQFVQFCQYKAESAGATVGFVDAKYTSQICPACGAIKKKELDERWHSCPCGCELDRDHAAAINIKARWVGRTLHAQA